ncbi:hypothetical protein BC834DRAFT_607881 [Gloeopeniophorella convolvens]|nr:hypothetical protein BC834DRAFT_607881 [Gloeopeniophorella convolvens]
MLCSIRCKLGGRAGGLPISRWSTGGTRTCCSRLSPTEATDRVLLAEMPAGTAAVPSAGAVEPSVRHDSGGRHTLQRAAGGDDGGPRRAPQDVAAGPRNRGAGHRVPHTGCRRQPASCTARRRRFTARPAARGRRRHAPRSAANKSTLLRTLVVSCGVWRGWQRVGGTSCEGCQCLAGRATRWRRQHVPRREPRVARPRQQTLQRASDSGRRA